jgi:chromosome segregation ATPase
MNHEDLRKKIGSKAEELRKLDAEEVRSASAVKAAEAEHVEALIAVELEESGAAGRVRKAETELTKTTKAAEDARARRKTLRTVLERMETEADNLRRAELFARRLELVEEILKDDEPRYTQALSAFLAVIGTTARKHGEIRDLENELDRLMKPNERLNRASIQLPLGSHIDLSQAATYASEVAALNSRRLEFIKVDPVQHTAIQGEQRPALRAVG